MRFDSTVSGGCGVVAPFGTGHDVPADPSTARPVRGRVVAEVCGHRLEWRPSTRAYYDVAGGVPRYLARYVSDREAEAMWRGTLRSEGVVA